MGTSLEEAALGIIRIAVANMEAAVRVITVGNGVDQRECTLVAFGGAGPLHACELVLALNIPRVLIPPTPGVLSAVGMLAADIIKDYVQTLMLPADEAEERVQALIAELEAHGRTDLCAEGFDDELVIIERYLDLRYKGQSYELVVPYTDDVASAVTRFHELHDQRFGYSDPDEPVQVVNVRLKARASAEKPALEAQKLDEDATPEALSTAPVVFASDTGTTTHDTPIYDRSALKPGMRFTGPAIITQYDTTTVILPRWRARVDAPGNLIAEPAEAEGKEQAND
jgi:N-methylhydantoinase A